MGELVVGNAWDLLFGVQLWSYNGWPLNVTQYTSIVTTLGFGGGAYLIFKFIYKPLLELVKRIPYKAAVIICLSLGILVPLDTLRMMISIIVEGVAPNFWRIDFRPAVAFILF